MTNVFAQLKSLEMDEVSSGTDSSASRTSTPTRRPGESGEHGASPPMSRPMAKLPAVELIAKRSADICGTCLDEDTDSEDGVIITKFNRRKGVIDHGACECCHRDEHIGGTKAELANKIVVDLDSDSDEPLEMYPSSDEEDTFVDRRPKLWTAPVAEHRRRGRGAAQKVTFAMDHAQEELRVTRMAAVKGLDDEEALNEAYEQNIQESLKCETRLVANIEKQIDYEKAQLPTYASQDPDFEDKWWAKRRAELRAGRPAEDAAPLNFFEAVEELHTLPPAAEPEFYETEVTLDTGATVHAADRMSFPGHEVKEGAGSRAGQRFQCAGNKMIDNEGEMFVTMFAPGCGDGALLSCFQAAKVTRPLLSVTELTDSGQLHVICKKEEALVIDSQQRVLAIFKRNGGLYTAKMKVKNPRFQPFHRQE